jgi:hypothetical protein
VDYSTFCFQIVASQEARLGIANSQLAPNSPMFVSSCVDLGKVHRPVIGNRGSAQEDGGSLAGVFVPIQV